MAKLPAASPLARRFGPLLAAAAALCTCAIAHAQAPTTGLLRLVAADAARLLGDPDPAVRAEAVLAVAARRDPRDAPAVLAVARDPVAATRRCGLVALGLGGYPDGLPVLAAQLAEQTHRAGPDAAAAALGLALLPPDLARSTGVRVLNQVLHGSWKRQRDLLLALLAGLGGQDATPWQDVLQRLYQDEANHDPAVRAALLRLLLPGDTFDGPAMHRILEAGSDLERGVALQWLAGHAHPADPHLLPRLRKLAASAPDPAHRAAALRMLGRCRDLAALPLAQRALAAATPGEAAAGASVLLALGGASQRETLVQAILGTTDAARQAALLLAFAAPPPAELVARCQAQADGAATPEPLRIAAARLLAHRQPERSGPLLVAQFRRSTSPDGLGDLARHLAASGPLPPLLALCDRPAELPDQPAAWQALLAIHHGEAERQVLAVLQDARSRPGQRLAALRAVRAAYGLPLAASRLAELPQALRELLQP